MKKKILILLISQLFLFSSTKITFTNIEEQKINEKKVLYTILAQSKNLNIKKLKKFRFYNKHDLISNSSFYENGIFKTKDLKVYFTRAYFLEGKFIMSNTKGKYKSKSFEAKKTTYSIKDISFENVFITLKNKKYKKLKYKILF